MKLAWTLDGKRMHVVGYYVGILWMERDEEDKEDTKWWIVLR